MRESAAPVVMSNGYSMLARSCNILCFYGLALFAALNLINSLWVPNVSSFPLHHCRSVRVSFELSCKRISDCLKHDTIRIIKVTSAATVALSLSPNPPFSKASNVLSPVSSAEFVQNWPYEKPEGMKYNLETVPKRTRTHSHNAQSVYSHAHMPYRYTEVY